MINLLRKNQRSLMLIVAILTIVAFIFLYNTATLDKLSTVRDPKIYGQSLNPSAIDRQVKNYQLTLALGQYDLLSKLGGATMDRSQALEAFVWNLLVLQHEARAMGVQPTDDQVADRIKTIPVFQTSGQFDPTKYAAFVRDQLAPRGFTERQLEEVIRDSLRVERISRIVEAPAAVSDAEMRAAARILQPVTATVVLFDATAAKAGVTVPDADVASYYEKNLSNLNTEETRAVRYVAFELPAGSNLDGKAKVDALQKLADAASKFVESLPGQAGGFEAAAKTAGLTVRESPDFNRAGTIQGTQAGDDSAKQLAPTIASLAPAAFLLQGQGTVSDVIQVGDAFYVVEISKVTPQRPLTLAEATPQIRERLLEVATGNAIAAIAGEKITKVREALAAGKTIEDAAAAAGLQTRVLDNVVPVDEKATPEQRTFIFPTVSLREGELSNAMPDAGGGFAVFLKSRAPLDEKIFEERKTEILDGLLDNKRNLLFAEWLRVSRDAANITVPRSNRG